MSETDNDKPKLGMRQPLGLKRTVETGQVKQSFRPRGARMPSFGLSLSVSLTQIPRSRLRPVAARRMHPLEVQGKVRAPMRLARPFRKARKWVQVR